jgi:phosphosulfolactate phosphohydrolase-like enzyme
LQRGLFSQNCDLEDRGRNKENCKRNLIREIISGSFPNAGAIVSYIQKHNPQMVSLIAMGICGKEHSDEDSLFAQHIRNV